MRISTSIDYAGDIAAAATRVQQFEAAGVDMVWVAEAYGFDGVSLAGYLAAKTERITIGTGILPVFSRTPALIAQTAAGLDTLSGGRFVLGLGASGPQVIEGWHGVPYDKPIARIREVIDICRIVWKRERLEYHGKAYDLPLPAGQGTGLGKPLKMITKPVRDSIPIFIASLGERSVEMCAELADGWLPFLYIPERAGDVWGTTLSRGLAKRSEALAPLDIVAGGLCAIGEGAEKLRDRIRPMIALYVGGMGARGKNFYNDVAVSYGYGDAARTIQDLYLDGKKEEAAAAIPAELVEQMTLCGPREYVRDRLAAWKAAGVTILNVTPLGDATATLHQLRDLV